MELAALIAQRLAIFSLAGISLGKLSKIIGSKRHGVTIQAKDDATSVLPIDFHVKEDFLSDGIGAGIFGLRNCGNL